jgi:hypothetical protein
MLPDGIVVCPPAAQGDVLRAVREAGATVIGLVDGVFRDRPAVWHKEILWALHRGVRVLGAASMGALRAAECAPFGMEPVGRIAQAFIAGRFAPFDDPFSDDDEVAVQHAPAPAGFRPLSDAMVDLRATLAEAWQAGAISLEERDAAATRLKAMPFRQRSLAGLRALLPAMAGFDVRLKQQDARALLDALPRPPPPPPPFRFERTLTWERFLRDGPSPASGAEEVAIVALALDPPAFRLVARAALGLSADAAPDLRGFREARGLFRQDQVAQFLWRNATDAAGLVRLAAAEAALDAALAAPPSDLHRRMADVLRLDGRFVPAPGPAVADAATEDAALGWYLHRLDAEAPPTPAEAARRLGFADVTRFTRAVVAMVRATRQDAAE